MFIETQKSDYVNSSNVKCFHREDSETDIFYIYADKTLLGSYKTWDRTCKVFDKLMEVIIKGINEKTYSMPVD